MEPLIPLPSPPSTAPASPASIPIQMATDGDEEGEAVILALEHESLPFWSVQFHPESIESNGGNQMMENFLQMVGRWWNEGVDTQEEAASKVQAWRTREGLPSFLRDLGGECVSTGTASLNKSISGPLDSSLIASSWSIISRRFKKEDMPSRESAPRVFEQLFRFGGCRSSGSKSPKGTGSVWLDSARVSLTANVFRFRRSLALTLTLFSLPSPGKGS